MIKYFDIFAGIGGFRSGLDKAGGFECVGYCEIDKYARLALYFGTSISGEDIPDVEGETEFELEAKTNEE